MNHYKGEKNAVRKRTTRNAMAAQTRKALNRSALRRAGKMRDAKSAGYATGSAL
jgi:hypothetical protein